MAVSNSDYFTVKQRQASDLIKRKNWRKFTKTVNADDVYLNSMLILIICA